MPKLEKKYPLGSLVKYKTPWMENHKFAIIVGYTSYVSPTDVMESWIKVLMPDASIQNFNQTYCIVVSKFYSKYKRKKNENRKRG